MSLRFSAIQNLGLSNGQVTQPSKITSVFGNNVFTLTKYKGYDPEFSATESIFGQGVDNTLEPLTKSLLLGLRIGL